MEHSKHYHDNVRNHPLRRSTDIIKPIQSAEFLYVMECALKDALGFTELVAAYAKPDVEMYKHEMRSDSERAEERLNIAIERLEEYRAALAAPTAAIERASSEASEWDYVQWGLPNEEVASMWRTCGHSGTVPFSFASKIQSKMLVIAKQEHAKPTDLQALTDEQIDAMWSDVLLTEPMPQPAYRALVRMIISHLSAAAPAQKEGE